MSGHSKWSNIQAKKGKADAARGKIFTKLGRELLVAVKAGGSDPAGNSKLKDVIAKCKAANMPNDTINNAIKKASRILGKYILDDCILISTAKSCPMCISAACWARIPLVKYVVSYEYTEKIGFIDKKIAHYIKGRNFLIKEEKINSEYAYEPFEKWQNNKLRENY